MLGAWLALVMGIIAMEAVPHRTAEAHAPYIVSGGTIQSWGALGVYNNWYYGCPRPSSCALTVAITDYYGLPSSVTGSSYYADAAWTKSDNLHTLVVKNQAPVEHGTAVYIYANPNDYPSTHAHLFGWNSSGQWVEDNALHTVFAWVEDIHINSSSVNCLYGGPGTCGAHVISHEVGHGLGLADETASNDGSIMYEDSLLNLPNLLPTSGDRRTEDACLWTGYRYFPC
jgi:hypothetical protein